MKTCTALASPLALHPCVSNAGASAQGLATQLANALASLIGRAILPVMQRNRVFGNSGRPFGLGARIVVAPLFLK